MLLYPINQKIGFNSPQLAARLFIILYYNKTVKWRNFCKTPPFAQFQRQAQILSLEILNVFLRLKFSPSLNLNKIEHFSKVSWIKNDPLDGLKEKK